MYLGGMGTDGSHAVRLVSVARQRRKGFGLAGSEKEIGVGGESSADLGAGTFHPIISHYTITQ
jgi:hypothetical protein